MLLADSIGLISLFFFLLVEKTPNKTGMNQNSVAGKTRNIKIHV